MDIVRRLQPQTPSVRREGPAVNEDISAPRVLLIDENGEKRGEVALAEALDMARRAGLDLVEVAPNEHLPVTKILDFGKMRFDDRKKRAAAKRKQKSAGIKEIKMRPNIDVHDYEVKTRAMQRFFDSGDKVKITLRFRGREMAHQELGQELLTRVRTDFEDTAKVEQEPKIEGRQMVMVMSPR